MNKSKQQALEKNGWKFGSANEFLGVEKLDFGFMQYEDMLEAYTYDENNKYNGHVHIFYRKNFFAVSAYFDKVLHEIKNDCKDIYEALDVANQWWNSIKNKKQNEENSWEHITKDKNGRVIKREKSDGFWEEFTYNDKGQELTYKCSNGKWREYSYNEAGKQLSYENSAGYWCKITYNKYGEELTLKTSSGFWYESIYDDKGQLLTYKCSDGFWEEYTYNENDECTHYKNSEGENVEYDFLGKLI